MLDRRLRSTSSTTIDRVFGRPAAVFSPIVWGFIGLAAAAGSAVAAWQGAFVLALLLFLASRLLDGIDGVVARRTGRQTDLGGYLDQLFDTIGYVAIPLGLAVYHDERSIYIALVLMFGSFYANTVSWTYLAAVLEKRGQGSQRGELTSITMPSALVEGTETIVGYCVMLLVPQWTAEFFVAFAVAVTINIVQRVIWAVRNL